MTQQNQSPVVTDEELIAALRGHMYQPALYNWTGPDGLFNLADDRLEALAKENFDLAANQCSAGYGDEYGNHRCRHEDAARALTHPSVKVSDERIAHVTIHLNGALSRVEDGEVSVPDWYIIEALSLIAALEAAQLPARPVVKALEEAPVIPPLLESQTDPAWVQLLRLFQRYNHPEPPVHLRDELVNFMVWAWYGKKLHKQLSALEGEAQ